MSLNPAWRNLALLTLLSALGAGSLLLVHMSAGLLLGPMCAAIFLSVKGKSVPVPKQAFYLAQAVLGLMVASSLSADAFGEIVARWPIVLFSVLSVIVVSFLMGAWLAWFRIIPGTTALWGSSPGGASTMVSICGDFGADPRLAAFMLYSRVVMVAVLTSLVAWCVAPHADASYGKLIKTAHITDMHPFWDLALILFCGLVLPRLKIPGGPLLGCLTIAFSLKFFGVVTLDAPIYFRIPAYLAIGWTIGARFTPDVMKHVIKALPAVAFSSACVVGACALLSWPIAKWAHVDLLSAYLSASPGGLDTIIIISNGIHVDLPFILSLQTARMIAVLVIGPVLARPVGRWLESKRGR